MAGNDCLSCCQTKYEQIASVHTKPQQSADQRRTAKPAKRESVSVAQPTSNSHGMTCKLITLRACCYPQVSTHKRAPSTHLAQQWSTGYTAGFKEPSTTRGDLHLKSTSSAPPTGLDSSTHYPQTTTPPLHGRHQKQSANSVESAGNSQTHALNVVLSVEATVA